MSKKEITIKDEDVEEQEDNNEEPAEQESVVEDITVYNHGYEKVEKECKDFKGGALKVGTFLVEHLKKDSVADEKYIKNKLSLKGVCNYIVEEVYKSAIAFNGKQCSFMDDNEVYNLAIHYVDETTKDKCTVSLPKNTKVVTKVDKPKSEESKKTVAKVKKKEVAKPAYFQLDFSDLLGI